MNKSEFYNSVVNVYNETGQGVPELIKFNLPNPNIVDELISEGFLKVVVTPYNHLPDDRTLCLTKGYCVEEEDDGNWIGPLSYVRFHRNIEQGLSHLTGMNNEALAKNPEFLKGYAEWLGRNHIRLTEKIELMTESENRFPEDVIRHIKSKKIYSKNPTVSETIASISEDMSLDNQIIRLSKEVVGLAKNGGERYRQKWEGAETDIRVSKSNLEIAERAISYLNAVKDKSVGIREII